MCAVQVRHICYRVIVQRPCMGPTKHLFLKRTIFPFPKIPISGMKISKMYAIYVINIVIRKHVHSTLSTELLCRTMREAC